MWLDIFNEMRINSKMSLDEISAKSGVPKGTLSKITSGITKAPPLETMRKLVYSMGYTLDDLDRGLKTSENFTKDEKEHIKKYRTLDSYGKEAVDGILDIEHRRVLQLVQPDPAQEIDADNIIELPLMFSKASAGRGFSIIEAPEEAEHIKIMYNQYTRKADFCVRVAGRSMEPKIYDGDIVLIRDQPAVDVNEIGLFTVDDLGYIKKMGPDRLISINPDFDDIFPEEYREVRCYGKFIAVLDPEWIIEDID